MRQWFVIYSKEMLEMWRSYKWLWVPLVFILLGIMQPVSTYYTPEIIKNFGNLPEGTIIQIPMPAAGEVLAQTIAQFGTVGVLILVLSFMAVVAGERQSGVLGLIMIKPVPHGSFITAKWAGMLTLTLAAFSCGYAAAWYYTDILFGSIQAASAIQGFWLYGLWLILVVTVTLLFSTLLRGNGGIAFLSILVVAGLSILTGLFAKFMPWSPARLTGHTGALLTMGKPLDNLGLCLVASVLIIAGLVFITTSIFKNKASLNS